MHNIFSEDEKVAFTQLLVAIARADGDITSYETEFLNDYCSRTGLDWKVLKNESIENILSRFKTFSSKVGVVQEVVKLAMIDGCYSEKEKNGVGKIAEMLSLPNSKVVEIENWVVDGIKWIAEGQAMRAEIVS